MSRIHTAGRLAARLLVGVGLAATTLSAQTADTARDVQRGALFTRRDALVAGAVVAGAVAVMPVDGWLRNRFEARDPQSSAVLHDAATDFRLLGDPGTVILSVGTYAVGRLARRPVVADVGLHATEALLLSASATALAKVVAGRYRPFASPRDADEFRPFSGLAGGRTSFPSGHTSASFAVASVVAEEGSVHWPHASHIVTPLAYGAATLVGLSRIYNDRHWASDVILGAAVGTYSGVLVERFARAHPHNALERWLVPSGIAPDGHGGAALVWSIR